MEENYYKKSNISKVLIFIIILLLIGCGIYYFMFYKKENNVQTTGYYVTLMVDDSEYLKLYTENGKINNVPLAPDKEGYTFSHWEYNGNPWNNEKNINSNIVIKAVYNKNEVKEKYIVTFSPNNGEINTNVEVNANEKVSEPTTPTKAGYTFIGWYNGNTKFDFNTSITSDITLIAKWDSNVVATMYGDVNEDGVVNLFDVTSLIAYVANNATLTAQGLKNADINADGKVDVVDAQLLKSFYMGQYSNTLPNNPITNYVLYGDVNEDGNVDGRDTLRLMKYLENTVTLTTQGLKNADINADGNVNQIDKDLLMSYFAGNYSNTLPNYPIKD